MRHLTCVVGFGRRGSGFTVGRLDMAFPFLSSPANFLPNDPAATVAKYSPVDQLSAQPNPENTLA